MLCITLLPVPQKVINLSYTFDEENIVFVTWMVSSIYEVNKYYAFY